MDKLSVCNIFCTKKSDSEVVLSYFQDYPVFITQNEINNEKPTLIIGWSYVKENYPDQNIFDKKINENLFWTFSFEEKKESFLKETKNFVEKSLLNWLPKDHILYDHFFDGNINEFVEKQIDYNKKVFIYYKDGALYISNNNKNYIFNIKNILYFGIVTIEDLNHIFNKENTVILSYSNMQKILNLEKFKGLTLDSLFWVKYNLEIDENFLFNLIPNFDITKYISFFMNMILPKEDLIEEEFLFLERMKQRDLITLWLSSREICVNPTIDLKGKDICKKDNKGFVKINYSNKRTKTNRIVCRDEWNIQNESKDSERRKDIISRFDGGSIMVCDYNSYETRISIFLTRNIEFIKNYKDKDIHIEVARIIFKKQFLSEEERDVGKLFNHALLYGASHNRLKEMIAIHIKDDDEVEEIIYYIKKFLDPIIINAKKINEECIKNGCIKTPWNSIIRPDKEYAAYNNLVQTIASEIMVDKLIEIREYLKDKKSQFLFQIYDSVIFDIAPDEQNIVTDLLKILSSFKKTSFNISYRFGKNYCNLFEKNNYTLK